VWHIKVFNYVENIIQTKIEMIFFLRDEAGVILILMTI